jgi:hypothetical protein
MMAMKPRPKLRSFCRWMLTILMVMFVVVWIGSGYLLIGCDYRWMSPEGRSLLGLTLFKGVLSVSVYVGEVSRAERVGIHWSFLRDASFDLFPWKWRYRHHTTKTFFDFPGLLPIFLVAIPTALMWGTHIRDRRRKPGTCPKCGYEITGLMGKEACPECGTTFVAEGAKTIAS